MQTRSNFLSRRLACNFILSLALLCLGIAPARAGLNFELHLYRSGDFYFFYTPLTTNGVAPDAALGSYVVFSPQWITGAQGAWRQFEMTSSNLNFVNGGSSGFSDLSSALGQITNGSWSILFTNATTTNLYQFTVSAPDLTSDMLPETDITFPISGSLNITNRPAFTWQGPGWSVGPMVEAYNEDASFFQYQNLPASASSWNIPAPLPYYSNVTFYISYQTNTSPSVFSAGAPLSTNLALPISGWTSSSVLESTANSFFTVGGPGIGASGHTNVAYWSFEDNSLFAQDFSGNGNNLSYAWFGTPPYISSDAEAGSYAGGFGGSGWFTAPSNLLSTLAGSFTVSAWVKTTDNSGNDDDSQYSAKGILSALDNNYSQAVMPMGLTGGKLAFYTGGASEQLLHSQASINTGQYVHVAVTRDQITGDKKIYINGALDSSATGTTDLLDGGDEVDIGYNNGQVFSGVMDDVQIYSGVLSASEIQQLSDNPGTTIPNATGAPSNGVTAHYDFDESEPVAADVSGNGNDFANGGGFGGSGPYIDADSVAGAGAVYFDGGSYLAAPATLLPALAKNFSISLWIKTYGSVGNPYDYALNGAGVISADVPDVANDVVPVALTGGHVAFNTGSVNDGYDDTLNSFLSINDNTWHHVVVTRNQATGDKAIYIDGELDNSDTAGTDVLDAPALLTIGALSDGSNPDPTSPDFTGYNGFLGSLDDIQIYSRVLSSEEVSFLYENPGQVIPASSPGYYPVNAAMSFQVTRWEDPFYGESFNVFPFLTIGAPSDAISNTVVSPHGSITGSTDNSSSVNFSSLQDLIHECTNGLWTLTINGSTATQQVYTFQVAISGLDDAALPPITIFSPTNDADGVSPNPVFYWAGLPSYSSLKVYLSAFLGETTLPPATTNWTTAPTLPPGTNRFEVHYDLFSFSGITSTTPMDNFGNAVSDWNTFPLLSTGAGTSFNVSTPAAVQLIDLHASGNSIEFAFQTVAGRAHTIETSTNLAGGAWQPLTNFPGDGSLWQFTFPATNGPVQFFRVSSQ